MTISKNNTQATSQEEDPQNIPSQDPCREGNNFQRQQTLNHLDQAKLNLTAGRRCHPKSESGE